MSNNNLIMIKYALNSEILKAVKHSASHNRNFRSGQTTHSWFICWAISPWIDYLPEILKTTHGLRIQTLLLLNMFPVLVNVKRTFSLRFSFYRQSPTCSPCPELFSNCYKPSLLRQTRADYTDFVYFSTPPSSRRTRLWRFFLVSLCQRALRETLITQWIFCSSSRVTPNSVFTLKQRSLRLQFH
jgi:hypothetical protein